MGLASPTSVPAGQTSSASTSNSNSLPTLEKYEIGIGVGVGVPVLVALVMIIVICARVCRRRRKSSKHAAYNLNNIYGTSAVNLREPAAYDVARAAPITIYASSATPAIEPDFRNRPPPLSPPTMDVPLVYSQGSPKLKEPASPLRTPPAFEAFNPAKRPALMTNFSRPDVNIPEQHYPKDLQRRPDSGSSYYSERGPYEMAP